MASFLDILAPHRVPDGGGPSDTAACVRHDLQALLDARRPPDSFTADFPELLVSVVNFGLRDFAFAEMVTAEDRERLAQHIKDVIEAFEPRLTDVAVTPREPDDGAAERDRDAVRVTTISFDVTARLVSPSGGARAKFENLFEWTTGRHEVRVRRT